MCESRRFVGLLTRHHRSHGYICTRCKLKVGSRSYNSALQPAGGAVWPRSSTWGAPGRVRDRRQKLPQTTEQVKESAEWEKLMVNSGFCVASVSIKDRFSPPVLSQVSRIYSAQQDKDPENRRQALKQTQRQIRLYTDTMNTPWAFDVIYFFYKNQAEDLIWVFSHWSMTSVDHNVHKHGRWHHR